MSAADSNAFARTPDSVVAPVAPFNAIPFTTVVEAGTRTWEIAVPNGNYQVRVVSGDASGTVANLGLHEAAVEGQTIVSDTLTVATAASHFADGTGYVAVTDGKLSLALPSGSAGKLHPAFIEITGTATASNAITPAPGTPLVVNRSASAVESVQPTSFGAGSGEEGGPSSANEINVASGDYTHDHGSDIVVRNPVGPSVSFGLTYRSAIAQNGYRSITGTTVYSSPGLPTGWTHEYDIHIEASKPGEVTNTYLLHYPNGQIEGLAVVMSGFTRTGRLTPPAGSPYAVVGTIRGESLAGPNDPWESFSVIRADESRLVFLPSRTNPDLFLLKRIVNKLGQTVELIYDTYNRVSQIKNYPTAANGNSSSILLTTNFPSGSAIPATFTPSDIYGRTIRYLVSGGQLTAISNIGNTKDVWTYAYQSVGAVSLLSTVSRPKLDSPSTLVSSLISYADDGTVSFTKDANNNTESYLYQANTGQTIVTRRDSTNKVVAQHTPKYATAFANRTTGSTDVNGNNAALNYGSGLAPYDPSESTNEEGQQASLAYDAFGNVTSSESPGGLVGSTLTSTISLTYDSAVPASLKYPVGRVTSVNIAPTGSSSNKTTSFTYYPSGLVNTVTSLAPLGSPATTVTTTYTYTSLGNVATVVMPGPNGATTTAYEYQNDTFSTTLFGADNVTGGAEAIGEPIKITLPDPDPTDGVPSNRITRMRYDTLGRLVRHYDALGNRTDFAYNDEDQIVEVKMPPTTGLATARARTVYSYAYAGGPLTKTEIFDESGSSTPFRTVNAVKGSEAEGKGVNGSAPTVEVGYDGTYRLNSIKDGKNQETQHDYATIGDLNEMRYPGYTGSGPADKIQFTAYDKLGNLNGLTNGRGNSVAITRQANNSLVNSVVYGGFPTRNVDITYDVYGRITQRIDGAGVYLYQYDDTDRITRAETRYRGYDVQGLVTSDFLPSQVLTYSYNQDGSVHLIGTAIGNYEYIYDDAGRMTRLVPPWSVTRNSGVIDYEYDAADQLISQKTKELTSTFTYDARGRQLELKNIGHFFQDRYMEYSYTNMVYDAIGNRLSADFRGDRVPTMFYHELYGWRDHIYLARYPKSDATLAWSYDDKDRLIGESRILVNVVADPSYSPAQIATFGYDYTSGGTQTAYQYDGAGNPTKIRGASGYIYNNDNQLVAVSGQSGEVYNYDGDGNPTTYSGDYYGSSGKKSYDEEGRFTGTSILYGGGDLVKYKMAYRSDGQLACYMRVNFGGDESGYQHGHNSMDYTVYDEVGGHALYNFLATSTGKYRYSTGEYFNTANNIEYQLWYFEAWGVSGLSQTYWSQASAGHWAVESFGYDPQGGVATAVRHGRTDDPSWAALNIIEVTSFDSYGKGIGFPYESGEYGKQWGYRTYGDYILCGQRWYNPRNARWLTRDPIGYEGGINLYAYCDGNPVMRVDPNGLDWLDDQANFWAGAGDSLTFGGTGLFRSLIGVNDVVNEGSGAYIAGMYTEMAVEIAASGGSAALKAASRNAARRVGSTVLREAATAEAKRVFPAAFTKSAKLDANGTKVLTKSGRQSMTQASIVHHNNPLAGHPWNLTGNVVRETLFPLRGLPATFNSGRWNLKAFANTAAGKAAHEATHIGMMKLENILMKGFNRYTIPARVVRNGYSRATNP